MNSLFEKKEYLLRFYGKNSRYIDKMLKFLLTLLVLIFIDTNIGFMPAVSHPLTILGVSIICAFLPSVAIALVVSAVVLLQFYTWAAGTAVIVAVIFFLIFIFCLRFTPNRTIILLITPVAFMLKIPVLVPIVCGLIGSPVWALPVAFGTLVYYMIYYVNAYGVRMGDITKAGFLTQVIAYPQQIFGSKEMLLAIVSMTVCLWLVYVIRRMSLDNSWKIAITAGAIANVIMLVAGSVVLELDTSYIIVIVGSFVAVFAALVLELFVFSVDYSRTEYLQFEDDEYYYYVKAVPKISLTAPEKTVKRINERQETATIDTGAVNKATKKNKTLTKKEEVSLIDEKDELLLAKTLEDELDIQKLIEEELKN